MTRLALEHAGVGTVEGSAFKAKRIGTRCMGETPQKEMKRLTSEGDRSGMSLSETIGVLYNVASHNRIRQEDKFLLRYISIVRSVLEIPYLL